MKNITVTKLARIAFSVLFGLCAIGNGMHYSTLFIIAAAVLMAPIEAIDKIVSKKNRRWLVIASVFLMVLAMSLSPLTPADEANGHLSETSSGFQSENDISLPISGQQQSAGSSSVFETSEESQPAEESTLSEESQSAEESDFFEESQPSKENTSSEESAEQNNPSFSIGNNPAKPVNASSVPSYNGNAYVTVNDNIPSFSEKELTVEAYESYGKLDSFGRCTGAIASCGTEIMPGEDEERGSISSIKPTGWVQAEYDFVSGKYLYNRCHLIGWQLSAENANKKNLITGTRYLNTEGMLPFENMIADYIKETGNHVAYRVTPIFEGTNLLCSGVQLEACSIEDQGEGICFNVYCYNVQPGVVIDYRTGKSAMEEDEEPDVSEEDKKEITYALNISTKKIHSLNCRYAKQISDKNYQEYTGDIEDLLKKGYTRCGHCIG